MKDFAIGIDPALPGGERTVVACSGCGEPVTYYPVTGRPGHFMSSHQCPPRPAQVVSVAWFEESDLT